jgi:hypothetical protein
MAVPKKRQGRPPKFESPEQLEKAWIAYVADCKGRGVPLTMSGLAVSLGIDRKTLVNYSSKKEFFPIIKKYRDLVESMYEEMLATRKNSVAGLIFILKNNWGWKDNIEYTGADGGPIRFSWDDKHADDSNSV